MLKCSKFLLAWPRGQENSESALAFLGEGARQAESGFYSAEFGGSGDCIGAYCIVCPQYEAGMYNGVERGGDVVPAFLYEKNALLMFLILWFSFIAKRRSLVLGVHISVFRTTPLYEGRRKLLPKLLNRTVEICTFWQTENCHILSVELECYSVSFDVLSVPSAERR